MPSKRSRRALIGAAAAVTVAVGGGAAVAATQGGSQSSFLDSVAKHLGVSRQKLDDATKAAAIDQVDAALAAGRITKAQADAIKQRIDSGDVPFLGDGRFGPGGPGPGFGLRLGGHGPFGDVIAAAAGYLGLKEADLRDRLRSGSSLADIAKAQSKDVAGLQQAIVDAATKDLDRAVTARTITAAQRDAILARLKAHVSDLVDAKPGDGPEHRFGGHRGLFGP